MWKTDIDDHDDDAHKTNKHQNLQLRFYKKTYYHLD